MSENETLEVSRQALNIIVNNLFLDHRHLSVFKSETVFVDKTGTEINRQPIKSDYFPVNTYNLISFQQQWSEQKEGLVVLAREDG